MSARDVTTGSCCGAGWSQKEGVSAGISDVVMRVMYAESGRRGAHVHREGDWKAPTGQARCPADAVRLT